MARLQLCYVCVCLFFFFFGGRVHLRTSDMDKPLLN